MTTAGLTRGLTCDDVDALALRYDVPRGDVLLIALNLFGALSDKPRNRARLRIRLRDEPSVAWHVIVPLNVAESPFRIRAEELTLHDRIVGSVERADADEAVGGYFRDGGRAATVNPNARSRCVGCAFCPNTLEPAADPRLAEERKLSELLAAMVHQHPRRDLSELVEVTVSTGCFERERLAVDHMVALRAALSRHGVRARLGLLSSVVTSDDAFADIARRAAPFVLRLTVECFTRRDLLLKASKAALRPDSMPGLLRRARLAGLDTSFTHIVGLDRLDDMCEGIAALMPHVNEFPNLQVYQAHNAIMAGLRARGAEQVEFYLRARREIETIIGPTGLRPRAWECYRPLWYFTFDGSPLVATP